jgi:hypothetical protein
MPELRNKTPLNPNLQASFFDTLPTPLSLLHQIRLNVKRSDNSSIRKINC